MRPGTKAPILFCDDGSEVALPSKWVICSACDGHGKSSAYLGAYTQDEMDQQGPEFFEEYISGGYDRTCGACDGSGKVQVADHSKMTKAQRRELRQQQDAEDYCRAEEEAERRMGC
jgi:RecJ-like exonuclease